MEEIAQHFSEEYTELLSRYKEYLSNAQIMSILQSVTKKQIGLKNSPERLCSSEEHIKQIVSSGPSFMEKYTLKEISNA